MAAALVGVIFAIAGSSFGAELLTAEVVDTSNDVTVTQGSSTNFNIRLSASGAISSLITSANPSTASVKTDYALDAGGSLTSSTFSAAKDFWSSGSGCSGGNCNVTWSGAPTTYSVGASISAAATTPVGTYTIALSTAAGTTAVTNPSVSGGKLNDATATSITVHVIAPAPPADSTPPTLHLPSNITAEATSSAGAVVSWSASADDADPAHPTVSCDATSGSTFPLGTTTVHCSASDAAGNTANGSFDVTVEDTIAPSISYVSRTPANGNGWNSGNVTVTWSCSDSGSGVVDSAINQTVTTEGANQSSTGTCDDLAGNSASNTQTGINIDKTAPAIALVSRTAANANGWNDGNVSLSWSCSDALSGPVDAAIGDTVSTEGAAQSSTGTCYDLAGNSASDSQTGINIDKTAPSIGYVSRTAPNAAGWNKTNVTVNWSCSDLLSGPVDAAISDTVTTEGAAQSSTGTCHDLAGNSASNTQTGINIDKTAPGLGWSGGPADGASYYFGSVPAAPTCSATDALSGPNGCDVTGYSGAVGPHTLTATAHDVAGNETVETRTYTVQAWTINGFYQPTDMSGVWNTVKNGSTVPLKFEVFSGSTELTDTAVVNQPLRATQTSCSGGTTDDIELLGSGSTALRYDATAGQFIYNWQTPKKVGYCYVVTVTTADGSSISANFRLK